jgi:hypothetical protein
MRKFGAVVLLSLCAGLEVLGCGGHAGIGNITSTISPSGTLSVDAGQTVAFTAAVQGDATNSGVQWNVILPGTITAVTSTTATFVAPAVTGVSTSAVLATPVKNALYSATTFINLYPVLSVTKPTLPGAKVGVAYSYQMVSAGGAAPVTWSVTAGSLPFGLSLSPAGLISGIPTTANSYSFTVTTADAAMTPMSFNTALTIVVSPATVTITTTSIPSALVSQPYSVTLAAQYGATPYKWTLATGSVLPAGLTLSTSGVIAGTPTIAGQYSFSVQVSDASTPIGTSTQSYTMGVYSPVVITPATLPQGSIKDAYSATLQSTGGDAPITWTVASGSLPAGLSLSSAGVIFGTPTAVGTSNFTVKAGDSFAPQQTATASYSITVVLSTLAITTTTLPPGTTGTAYTASLASTGGNAPVTWSLSGTNPLPPGLSLSAAGVISGNPTTAGTYSITVQATDSTPASVTQLLSIKVVVPSNLKIATTSLPNGNIATAYSTTLAATLGTPPYTWSLAGGALPSGFTLSAAGVISGTTYVANTYSVTVAVTDSTGATVTAVLPLVIGTTLPAGVGSARLSGNYAFQLTGQLHGSAAGNVYGFATLGSVAFDGVGSVTGIEDTNTPAGAQTALAITGKYTVGTDGRGVLALTVGTTTSIYTIAASTPVSGISQSVAISEFDNSDGTGAVASGSAIRQTTIAFAAKTLTGTFAFGLSGESPCSTCATSVRFGTVAAAGILTADGASVISAGLEDSSEYGKVYASIPLTGTFTAPSTTTGRGTLTLTTTGTVIAAPPTNFTYVIVSANEMLLLSTDSHATTALLSGDARLQQQTTYSTATFTGTTVIAYESKADGGDGVTTYPTTLDAMVSAIINTGLGSDTFQTDSNIAGTFTAGTAKPETYTTASNGRATFVTGAASNHVVYLYDIGSGFGVDNATTGNYPAALRYELQVINGTTLEPLLYGAYSSGNLATPVAAALASGVANISFNSGGLDGSIGGKITTTTDSSTPAGVLTAGQTATTNYLEDTTGRFMLLDPTSSVLTGIAYAITGTRGISIPATSAITPTVTVLQQ